MKLNGREVKGPNVEYVVIPRHEGDLIFKFQAVLDMSEFETLCPPPKPGQVMLPGGAKRDDEKDPVYIEMLRQHRERRFAFTFLKSIEPSNIEWDTVKWEDPSTWTAYEKELTESGFSFNEIQLLQIGAANANGINQAKLDEARNRFLASLIQPSV